MSRISNLALVAVAVGSFALATLFAVLLGRFQHPADAWAWAGNVAVSSACLLAYGAFFASVLIVLIRSHAHRRAERRGAGRGVPQA